jgi:hypothetical protein
VVDFTSGAAIATAQMLQLLQKSGFACQAYCGARLDAPEEALLEEMLANQKSRYEARRVKIGAHIQRMIFAFQGDVPITIFQTASTRGKWSGPEEIEAFLKGFATFLDRNRPDVMLTYGGGPVAQGMIQLAKRRDIPIVFCLHNFLYPDPKTFERVDYVVVPSDFSREYHWQKLGLACHTLPNVVDFSRVEVADPRPQYVSLSTRNQSRDCTCSPASLSNWPAGDRISRC